MKGVKYRSSISLVDRGVNTVPVEDGGYMEVYRTEFNIRIQVDSDKLLIDNGMIDHLLVAKDPDLDPPDILNDKIRYANDTAAVLATLMIMAANLVEDKLEIKTGPAALRMGDK